MDRTRSKAYPPPQQNLAQEGYVVVGRVVARWGLHGHVKVEPLSDFPERFAPGSVLYIDCIRHEVQACLWRKGRPHVKLSAIDTADAAEDLQGRLLEVPEQELHPLGEDQYYRHQIIGLEVRTAEGQVLGRVTEIITTAANDVFVVRGDQRGELLLPAIGDVIRHIDVEAGYIEVEPISEIT